MHTQAPSLVACWRLTLPMYLLQPDVVTKYKAAAKIVNSERGEGGGRQAGQAGAAADRGVGNGMLCLALQMLWPLSLRR